MNKRLILIFLAVLISGHLKAQYWEGDRWYNNPLGFEPVKLHTSMGFLVPAIVVGTGMLLDKNKADLQNRLTVFNESGFSWGYKYPQTYMAQNNTGFNLMLRWWMSVGTEFDLYFPFDEFNNTIGFAIRPFARFYPLNKEKWRIYFESGGGLVYFFDHFPKPNNKDFRLGTKLNGTTKYGFGSEINLSSQTSVLLGVRHLHVSNGNTKGSERNPSHDSNGFFIGFSHQLKNKQ